MPQKQKQHDNKERDSLRAAIAKITGRTTVSGDVVYLRRRLAELRDKRPTTRDHVDDATDRGQAIVTVSMHDDERDALTAMTNRLQLGRSATIRAGLRLLAMSRAWADLAKKFDREDAS